MERPHQSALPDIPSRSTSHRNKPSPSILCNPNLTRHGTKAKNRSFPTTGAQDEDEKHLRFRMVADDASPPLRLISHQATSSPPLPPGATREQTTASSSATSTSGYAGSAGTARNGTGTGRGRGQGRKSQTEESRNRADEGTREEPGSEEWQGTPT
jgi:hypothetical protein